MPPPADGRPHSQPPGQPRGHPRSQPGRLRFAGLGYALTVLLTGTNLATPLYAGYERMFRLSPLDVTLLVAVYAAAVVVALLICGPLSDTAGYRPVLVAGLAAAACGSALLAAASGPAWLFAGRAVQGLAVGTCSGALTATWARRPGGRSGSWCSRSTMPGPRCTGTRIPAISGGSPGTRPPSCWHGAPSWAGRT